MMLYMSFACYQSKKRLPSILIFYYYEMCHQDANGNYALSVCCGCWRMPEAHIHDQINTDWAKKKEKKI
jgi:hypothetical protein